MHAQKVLHKLLDKSCSWMHTARRNVLQVTVLAAIDERRLSVTGLGRAIDSDAQSIGSESLFFSFLFYQINDSVPIDTQRQA